MGNTHRQCHVEITNQSSNYILRNPRMYIDSGSCTKSLPATINLSETVDALFTKTPHTARGAVGIFTYELLNTSTKQVTDKIAVAFSVPYDYNLYDNWYAVGIFNRSNECYDLYNLINGDKPGSYVKCKACFPSLFYIKDKVVVMVSMTDDREAVMKVEVSDGCNNRIEE